jgi:c-di-GMP-binding flagellar brake protein YcgR
MFYRRKHHLPYSEKRAQARVNLPDAESLVIEVNSPTFDTLHGELIDLSIRGAAVVVPVEFDPPIAIDEVVELTIAHPIDGWSVQTPVCLRRAHTDGSKVHYGFEFINEGNLYAQLENAMARYFNRRRAARIEVELDQQPVVRLMWGRTNALGKINDVSRDGIGVTLDLVHAQKLYEDDHVQVRFKLPEVKKPVECGARVARMHRLGDRVFVGLQLDQDAKTGLNRYAAVLEEYVARLESAAADWGDQFAA